MGTLPPTGWLTNTILHCGDSGAARKVEAIAITLYLTQDTALQQKAFGGPTGWGSQGSPLAFVFGCHKLTSVRPLWLRHP